MILCLLLIAASFGAGIAVFTGYPLYLGVLAGLVYLSVVLMATMLPGFVMDKLEAAHRRRDSHNAETLAVSV